jgi:hypothetical protein
MYERIIWMDEQAERLFLNDEGKYNVADEFAELVARRASALGLVATIIAGIQREERRAHLEKMPKDRRVSAQFVELSLGLRGMGARQRVGAVGFVEEDDPVRTHTECIDQQGMQFAEQKRQLGLPARPLRECPHLILIFEVIAQQLALEFLSGAAKQFRKQERRKKRRYDEHADRADHCKRRE